MTIGHCLKTALTNKVWCNDAVARSGQHWDHLAVEKGPAGLAVETENHGAILGSLVNIVNPGQDHTAPGINTGKVKINGFAKM